MKKTKKNVDFTQFVWSMMFAEAALRQLWI